MPDPISILNWASQKLVIHISLFSFFFRGDYWIVLPSVCRGNTITSMVLGSLEQQYGPNSFVFSASICLVPSALWDRWNRSQFSGSPPWKHPEHWMCGPAFYFPLQGETGARCFLLITWCHAKVREYNKRVQQISYQHKCAGFMLTWGTEIFSLVSEFLIKEISSYIVIESLFLCKENRSGVSYSTTLLTSLPIMLPFLGIFIWGPVLGCFCKFF